MTVAACVCGVQERAIRPLGSDRTPFVRAPHRYMYAQRE